MIGYLLIAIALVALLVFTFGVLGRARESARRASSANVLMALGAALRMYTDTPANHQLPDDPAQLYPDFVRDSRAFVNPRFPDEAAGYIYVSGSKASDAMNIVMYENVPANHTSDGLNVLLACGSIEWRSMQGLEIDLIETENAIRITGGTPKRFPMNRAEIKKRAKKQLGTDAPEYR